MSVESCNRILRKVLRDCKYDACWYLDMHPGNKEAADYVVRMIQDRIRRAEITLGGPEDLKVREMPEMHR